MDEDQSEVTESLRVMVVDDDVVFRRYLEAQLRMIGYQVVPVENGDAAWILIQADPPDMVLLDVFMPGMSGLDLCRLIKTTPATQDIPVVLLTMLGAKAKDGGYQAGADDFLNKPPHLLELKTRLRNLLLLRQLQSARAAVPEDAPTEELEGPPAHILILDPQGFLRDHLKGLLADEGWDIQGVATQEQLVERLRLDRPDLLILDQDLTEGTGSSLVSRLRSDVTTADQTILLTCESGALELQVGIWQSEADEHLVKPFEAFELKTRVRALLKRSELRRRKDAHILDADPSSIKDPHGGAYTRPYLYASLEHFCAFATLVGRPVGLLGFRLVAGSTMWSGEGQRVSDIIKKHLDDHEVLCRLGDGLFVAILPGADLNDLTQRVARLKSVLPAGHFATASGKGKISTSLLKNIWEQLRQEA
jgi:two-component system, cell cycle response regulator